MQAALSFLVQPLTTPTHCPGLGAAQECTTFHFDVKPDCLRPALDRFAQFFISPLVKGDALEREVQAVDNEFAGVLQVWVGGGRSRRGVAGHCVRTALGVKA